MRGAAESLWEIYIEHFRKVSKCFPKWHLTFPPAVYGGSCLWLSSYPLAIRREILRAEMTQCLGSDSK